MQPFQQKQGDQGCPNLNAERILAGADETLHGEVLFQRLEQLNGILPINNGFLKSRFITPSIPCVHIACQ